MSLDGSGVDLHRGDIFEFHIAYDGANSALTLTDTATNKILKATAPGNIAEGLGSESGYFGFTGATGQKTAIQNILAWTYSGGEGCSAK